MIEFGLPLSPAPSPVPSVRRLRLQSPDAHGGNQSLPEKEIRDLFLSLPPEAQARVLKELIHHAGRDALLEAHSVLEPRLRHDPFRVLPLEISLRVLAYITDPKSLAAAAQVSRRWYFLLRDDSTWKKMCSEHRFRRLSAVGSYIHHWQPEVEAARGSSEAAPAEEEEAAPAISSSEAIEFVERESDGSGGGGIGGIGGSTNSTYSTSSSTSSEVAGGPGLAPGSAAGSGGSRARRSSLLRLGYGTDPQVRYGFRLPNWERRPIGFEFETGGGVGDDPVGDPESDPIGDAYYDPRACVTVVPDSYRSHFQQQYMQSQAWATGGRLAGRYSLPNHESTVVTSVVMSAAYFVVALDSSLILVFHSDGQLVRSLYGHVLGVWTLALNGNVLISGGCDRDVREWDLSTGHCVKILRGHASTVRCLALAKGVAISGSRDTTVRVWDLARGAARHVLCGHSGSVRRVEFLPSEDPPCRRESGGESGESGGHRPAAMRAVSASYDTTAVIWDVEAGTKLYTLRGHTNQIYALAVSPRFVVTGALDHSIRVWDAQIGKPLGCLFGHTALVGQLALRDSVLVSGGSDGSVRIWDLEQMRCVHRIAAHDNTISSLSFNADHIVTGGADCQIAVWNVHSGELIRMLAKESVSTVWAVAAQEDRLLTVYSEGADIVIELMSFVPPPM